MTGEEITEKLGFMPKYLILYFAHKNRIKTVDLTMMIMTLVFVWKHYFSCVAKQGCMKNLRWYIYVRINLFTLYFPWNLNFKGAVFIRTLSIENNNSYIMVYSSAELS